jgi:hypothetical protein
MFPAKSEEFLTPMNCVSLTFSGAKNSEFRISSLCAILSSHCFLGSFDDDRQPSQSDCITIDYAIFFTHPPLPDVLAYARTSGT